MKKILFFSSIILIFLITAAPSLAQGPDGEAEAGRVVIGSNLTLDEGDFIDGDVVVFGGNFVMEPGSEVKGDVVVFGGNVTIEGKVKGDVVGIGGNVDIEDSAVIKGDVASLGGNVSVADDAEISGTVANGLDFTLNYDDLSIQMPAIPDAPPVPNPPKPPEIPEIPEIPKIPEIPLDSIRHERQPGFIAGVGRFVGDGVQNIFMAIIVAGLSVLIILFFPSHINTIQNAVEEATPTSFIIGIITLPAAIIMIGLLAVFSWLLIPICGIIIVALALAAAMLVGWAVIGKFIGARIFAAFENPNANDISATLLGVGVLTLITYMPFVDKLPLFGWMFALAGFLVGLLASATGLGAVVLTRFGAQPYQGSPSLSLASASQVAAGDEPGTE